MKSKQLAKRIVVNSTFLSSIRRNITASKGMIDYKNIRKKYLTTKYPEIISSYKNKYEGERCFIIGNGPSLKAEDLNMLVHEYTFAANRIHFMYEKTNWRPTFFMCQDEYMIQTEHDKISGYKQECFIGYNSMVKNNVDIPGVNAFLCDDRAIRWRNSKIPFSFDFSENVIDGSTITYSSIQLAIYMGFKEIYLIGVDNKYANTMDKNRKITHDSNVKSFFDERYSAVSAKIEQKIGSVLSVIDPEMVNAAYRAAQEASESCGVKIYNATRGGYLEAFERVDLDQLFKEQKVSIYKSPISS